MTWSFGQSAASVIFISVKNYCLYTC